MAEEVVTDDALSSADEGDTKVPAMAYGEMGFTGLITLGGRVWDECSHELRWPYAYKTFKQMALDGAVHPSLDFVESKIAEANWVVRIPKKAPKELVAQLTSQKEFVESVMEDMEHSWTAMIKDASSFNRYGFSTLEKVYRYRNKKYGSKHEDGRVGLKKIVGRSQGTIDRFEWKNKGRDIKGFWQRVITPEDSVDINGNGWEALRNQAKQEFQVKFIPRYKYLHFRHNPQNDSPVGSSPLAGVWQAYKMKQAYQESEAIGTAQDNNAFKILYLPPEYLVTDADEDRKASFEMYKTMLEKAHQAKQSGFILPMLTDSEGKRMFDFEIKNISGSKSYDVNKIIERYTREIQVGLFADVLSLGGGSGGSYSLAESKVNIIDLAVKSRLNEIKDQLNHDLMTQLFEQNAWSTEWMPYFDYELPNMESLDNKGKYYQRVKAVGLLPVVPAVVNQILKDCGIDYQVDDDMTTEELMKILAPMSQADIQSEAGKGMESGLNNSNGSGTGKNGDSSTSNKENN